VGQVEAAGHTLRKSETSPVIAAIRKVLRRERRSEEMAEWIDAQFGDRWEEALS